MGDALAEAQLQQAGNQFWGWLLATVVSAGYFAFLKCNIYPAAGLILCTSPFQCCGSGIIYSGFGSRYYRTYANLQLKEL